MKLIRWLLPMLIGAFLTTGAFAQADPYINVQPQNSGIVNQGGTILVDIAVGNANVDDVPAGKVIVQFSVPGAIASIPVTGHILPPGWTIISNSGTSIQICNSSSPIAAFDEQTLSINVQGNAVGGPLTIAGQLNITTNCNPGATGSIPGDDNSNNSSQSTIQVVGGCNLSVTASTGTIACNGGTTTLTATATGAAGTVEYSLNGGAFGLSNTFTVSAAGSPYTVTARLVSTPTCVATSTAVTVTQPTAITASASAGTITCFGGSTTLTVTASGGTGALQYSLNGGAFQAGNTFTVNAAGSPFTVTVRDANLCTATTNSVTVTQPTAITASASAGTITCFGGTATLTVTASGGTGALQYSLNGGAFQSGNTFTVNAAGSPFTVTVRDANLCTATTNSVTVTQPTAITASAAAGTIVCFGGTATLTVTASGGTGTKQYSLNGGAFQSGNTFTVNAAGSPYTVIVRDANLCTATTNSVTVTQPTQLTASASAGTIACFGGTATLTVTASGGTGTKQYSLNGGAFQSGNTFTINAAGSPYTVTVRDANLCTATTNSVTVTQPTTITASASAGTIACFGGTTTLTVTASGGTGALQYSLNGGAFQSGNTFTVNAAGSPYTVTVRDANLCTATTNSVTVTQPTQLTASASAGTIACFGGTATLTVTASGGTGTKQYSLNGGAFQSGNTFTINAAGSPYTVTVRDANLCTATTNSVTVTQPTTITASASAGTITCFGGTTTLTVTASGGTGALQYSLNGGAFQSGNTFTVNAAGSPYTVTVRDANLCTATTNSVTVTQPTAISASASAGTIACFGGTTTLTVTASGGTGTKQYSLNGGAFQAGNTFTVNAAGSPYTVTVRDANLCTTTVAAVTVTQPTALTATASSTPVTTIGGSDGTATANPSGGTPPYTYSWNSIPVQTTITATGLTTGSYTVTVTDSRGCITTATTTVGSPACNITATAAAGTIACFGGTTTLTVTASGGTGALQYSLNGGAFQAGNTFTVNAAGSPYTVTVRDANLCTATTNSVTVTTAPDIINPTITAPANVTVCTNSGCTATGVMLGTAVTADNCVVASVTNNAPGAFPLGSTTVTWTVTDGSGNSATATQTVTVNDCTVPAIYVNQSGLLPGVTGSSSSASPYLLGAKPGVKFTSILTVPNVVGGYAMAGIPDGLGAFDNNDGTFTLLMNHELVSGGAVRAHGGTGSFVSKWIINKSNLQVISGSDLMQSVYGWNTATQSSNTTTSTFNFSRFCSADLPAVSAYYNAATGLGTKARIYMHGEENNPTGWQLASVASGPDAGKTYVLGKFSLTTNGSGLTGVGNWENALASPFAQNKTIVIANSDGGTGIMNNAVAVYVGTKTNTGSEADKAGLTNGTLSFVNVTGNPVEIVSATTRATNITSGTTFTLSGTSATTFSRPEDGAWNPANPSQYFFVTTDQLDQVADGIGTQVGRSRLWRLNFTDITNPALGGTIDLLLTGTEGINMLDNMAADKSGHLLLQEDVGNAPHNGKIWQYTIATGALVQIAKHDPARFGDRVGGVTTPATAPFNQDEESSGIIDVSDILGAGMFLTSAQAHYGLPSPAVEGGQLMAMFNPESVGATGTAQDTIRACSGTGINLGTPATADNCSVASVTNNAPSTFPTGTTIVTWTVTDGSGNAATATQVVIVSDLAVSATSTPVTTSGGTDGTATAVATGGKTPYTYAWVPGGQTTATATGLTAGTYTVTVTDAAGCTRTATTTIAACNLTLTASAGTIGCFGGTTTLTATASGANGAVEYSITGGAPFQVSNTFTVGAGTYTVTAREVNSPSCTATATPVTITQPTAITASASAGTIQCNGGTTTVTVTASGGTAPYQYSLNNGLPPFQSSNTFTVGAGNIAVTVKDANGCTAVATLVVTQPTALLATSAASAITVVGGTTTVTVSASGGTAPYTGTGSFVRTAGTYNFTVTDAHGCSKITTITLEDPLANAFINVLTANGGQVTVGQTVDLEVTIGNSGPTGAIGPNKVRAQINIPGAIVSLLPDGQQTGLPPGWTILSNTGTGITICNGSDVIPVNEERTIILKVQGDVAGGPSTIIGQLSFGPGGGVCSGPGSLNGDDPEDNSSTTTVVVVPACNLLVTASAGTIGCFGGTTTLTATASGANGAVEYSITGGAPFQVSNTFTVGAGTYTVTAREVNSPSCTATATPVTITQPTAITASASAGTIQCNGGTTTVTVTASGGTAPYQYSLNNGLPPFQSGNTFTVGAGNIAVTVKDANGCTAVATLVVTQPTALLATSAASAITVVGGTTTVTVSASGGTAPYTGTGSFVRTAGTYNFTVTDAHGCSKITTITLEDPLANAFINVLTANGGQVTVGQTVDLEVTIGNSGPTGAIGPNKVRAQINIPGAIVSLLPDGQQTGLPPGWTILSNTGTGITICNGSDVIPVNEERTIILKVQGDVAGGPSTIIGQLSFGPGGGVCSGPGSLNGDDPEDNSSTTTVVVVPACNLTLTASAGTIGCFGGTTTLTATASGANGAVEYSITGGAPFQVSNTFTVGAGTYTVTAREVNSPSCTATATPVTITQPTAITASASAGTIQCNGGTTTVTVTASGGTAPYQYSLNGGALQSGNTFTVGEGSYTVTVKDANGCTAATAAVPVSQPAVLVAASTATAIACNGGSTTVTVTATGGTAPYTGTGTFSRAEGIYTFIVTDANGCTAETSITLTQPAVLVASSTATAIACNGGSSTVTVTATGGTAPYTGTGTFSRTAGIYTFTVTDANGCTAVTTITLIQPAVLVATSTAGTIACNGGSTTVTVSATGGTASYTGTGTFTRAAGTYTFTVTDGNGCTAVTTITLIQPTALTATATATPASGASNGTATVTATGGTPPYTYSWNTVPVQTTQTATSLAAGTYTVTVTDAGGCTTTASATVISGCGVIANAGPDKTLCPGETVTLTASATGGSTSTPPPPQPFTEVPGSSADMRIFSGNIDYIAIGNTFSQSEDRTNCGKNSTASKALTLPAGAVVKKAYLYWSGSGSLDNTVKLNGITVTADGTKTYNRSGGFSYFGARKDVTSMVTGSATYTVSDLTWNNGSPYCNDNSAYGGWGMVVVYQLSSLPGTRLHVNSEKFQFTYPAGTYSTTINNISVPAGCSADAKLTFIAFEGDRYKGENLRIANVLDADSNNFRGQSGPNLDIITKNAPSVTGGTTSLTYSIQSYQTNTVFGPAIEGLFDYVKVLKYNNCPAGNCNGYTYEWKRNGTVVGTTQSINTSTPGTYTVKVKDCANCSATDEAVVSASTLAATSTVGAPINCNGGTTTVTVAATGGTAPYTGTGVFTKGAGTWSFTVTDAKGCTKVTSVTITQPSPLTASATAGTISCNGGTTTVTVNASGGTAPYTGTGTFTKSAGTYSFTVTDSKGCTKTVSITISQPTQLVATATAAPIPCGGTTTTVTVSASGGTAPYTGTGNFTKGPGTWNFTVTDAKGCTKAMSITIAQPTALIVSATAGTISCYGGTTTVTVTASGGTAPYSGTGVFTKGAGTWSFTVSDARGCSKTISVTITQPSQLTVSATAPQIPCGASTTTVSVTASGGTAPYTGTGTFTKPAGTHTFTVTDSKGCSKSVTITVTAVSCGPVDPNKCYKLIARHSGKALTVYNSSTSNSGNVEQRSYSGGNNQTWKFVQVETGYYEVINVNSGKVLDVTSASTSDGANVQQWVYAGGNNQKWSLTASGSYFVVKAKHSGKAMSVAGSSSANGANVEQRGTGSNQNEQWSIVEVGCENYLTRSSHPGASEEEITAELLVTVQPNPSISYFDLTIKSNDKNTPVNVRILDAYSKVISIHPKVGVNSTLRIGSDKWAGGIYFAEVTQGDKRKVVKMVRAN